MHLSKGIEEAFEALEKVLDEDEDGFNLRLTIDTML